MKNLLSRGLVIVMLAAGGTAHAKLPSPTPEQAAAAAAKKAKAAEQAEKDKQSLANSMDDIAARWRKRAAENGWQTNPATTVAAPAAAIGAPASPATPVAQPSVQQINEAKQAPVTGDKAGTAAAGNGAQKAPAAAKPAPKR